MSRFQNFFNFLGENKYLMDNVNILRKVPKKQGQNLPLAFLFRINKTSVTKIGGTCVVYLPIQCTL
jgi:hypothetical protein